jgi:hypothetical protein
LARGTEISPTLGFWRLNPHVTRNMLGRNVSPVWTNRRLLLRGRERRSQAALTRKWNGCVHHDPTGQILFAWTAKEAFRAFYRWWGDAAISELTTVAETIETRWPAHRGVSSRPPVQGPNRGHEPVDQAGETRRCGVRNWDNHRRRVRQHSIRKTRRLSARKLAAPRLKLNSPVDDNRASRYAGYQFCSTTAMALSRWLRTSKSGRIDSDQRCNC